MQNRMDGGGGEQPANKTTEHRGNNTMTKGKEYYNNTNREIDHQELANMLRDRREFGRDVCQSNWVRESGVPKQNERRISNVQRRGISGR